MIGSVQHQLVKWLLQTVFKYFSNLTSDSFTFTEIIGNCLINSRDKILVSFDIVGLYTNVLLQEIVQIFAYALYTSCLGPVIISKSLFFEFMYLATEGMELNFDGIMYGQNQSGNTQ